MQDTLLLDSEAFIAKIATTARSGFGFTPLFGSGMSSPSGIIMGMEFSNYLAYCVDLGMRNAWDFRSNGWPPYNSDEEYHRSLVRIRSCFDSVCRKHGFRALPDSDKIVSITPDDQRPGPLPSPLNAPPIPVALRSPSAAPSDEATQRLAHLLHSSRPGAVPYDPLWPKLSEAPDSASRLEELGVRSLADWRTALHFISRLEYVPGATSPRLANPDSTIIDRFNSFIVAGKQPNLGHKMLVHLQRPLRVRTVLTTNFDELIEGAFAHADIRLTKYVVSSRGELPDPMQVRSSPSIIKLHGERLETRADLTLDDEPAIEDQKRFVGYFSDGSADERHLHTVPSHLLVAGFSASDLRIIRLIQHLLLSTHDIERRYRPKVFWIAFNEFDVARVRQYFPPNEFKGRVLVHQTVRPDLLFMEMYQRVSLSLPPGGLTFEYSHNIPPARTGYPLDASSTPPLQDVEECVEAYMNGEIGESVSLLEARNVFSRFVGNAISTGCTNVPERSPDRGSLVRSLYVISSTDRNNRELHPNIVHVDMPFGALASLKIPYEAFLKQSGHNCLWFELADYLNADSLLRDILRAISLRVGRFQSQQVTLHPLTGEIDVKAGNTSRMQLHTFLSEMCQVWRVSPSRWTIFVYGRELAGSCIGWTGVPWSKNDWICLNELLYSLADTGFQIVYAQPSQTRLERQWRRWEELCGSFGHTPGDSRGDLISIIVSEWQAQFLAEKKAAGRIPDADFVKYRATHELLTRMSRFEEKMSFLRRRFANSNDGESFSQFFHAVTLFRQSRAPSALFCEAVQRCPSKFNIDGVDNDLRRSQAASGWVRELLGEHIFYQKPGGFNWMQRGVRRFACAELQLRDLADGGKLKLVQSLAYTHFWIGDWYFKAFCSTGYTLPLIECLHHRFRAAVAAEFAHPRNIAGSEKKILRVYRLTLLRSSVLEMTKTLLLSRHHLKLWLGNEHGFPMFKAQGIDRVCVIHNDRQRTSGRSRGATRERTLKSVLTSVADSIATGADADVEDLVDDIKMQVRLLESSITTMDRAIREEATLRRQGVEVAPLLMGAHEKQEEIPHGCIVVDLAKVVSAIYCDVWIELIEVEGGTPLWKKAKKVLYKILERRKQSMSDLLQFDFLDEDGNFVVTSYKDNDGKLRSYAKEKGKCLQGFAPSFARLLPMLVFIEQLAYLWLRRAKFLGHTQDIEPNERWTAHHDKEIRRVWLRVTQLCNLGIDWCKHLPARFLQLELQLKVRMHSYYAVALANLDRFYEAHRHLDEAAGLNSKRDVLLPAVERAKLRLRRAEVFLTEAHRVRAVIAILNDDTLMKSRDGETVAEAAVDVWMRLGEHWDLSEVSQDSECGADGKVQESQFPRNKVRPRIHPAVRRLLFRNPGSIRRGRRLIRDLDRLMVATLDDAWVQLEYAEGALSGQSQSNLWWGRLAVMKIRAFGYQFGRFGESHRLERSRRMLAYRHRRMNPQVIWELFEGSFLNNKRCEYRMLRLIRYTAEALRVCVVLNDEREWIETRCFDLRQRRDEIGNELEGTDRSRMFRMIGMAGHAIDRLELALSGTTAEKKQT